MNRNSIRKATTCCLTAAVVLTGSSFVSHAAVSAGAGDLISAATEAPADTGKKADKAEDNNATAGVTEIFANSLAPRQEAIDTGAAKEEAEAPAKTEYDDIAIAQVDNYVNVRSAASEEGEVLGKLYNNSACTVLGTEGDWYTIPSCNVEGYINS